MNAIIDHARAVDLRARFPILSRKIHGQPLVYLDNAATSQVPDSVVEAMARFEHTMRGNVHRGVHTLSQEATAVHEGLRDRLATFVGASRREEIVLTHGCTESINLVAHSWGSQNLSTGDVVLVGATEHHANIVPWQIVTLARGARVLPIPCFDDTTLDLESLRSLLAVHRVRLVAVQHASNVFGTVHPVAEIARLAHEAGALCLVDAAQSAPHMALDVASLGADFLAFSGHKLYGPTGTGMLWGRHELLSSLPPFLGGGDMIDLVSWEGTTYHDSPWRFEAGTPHFTGSAGFTAALDFVEEVGIDNMAKRGDLLAESARQRLSGIRGLRILGTAPTRVGVVSFVIDGVHPYDAGVFLDQMGIAVRTGHHCCQPAMSRFGVPGTIRASFSFFNTQEEVDVLVAGVSRLVSVLAPEPTA